MKYKIYLDELEEETNKIINYSKRDINDKINEIREIGNDIKWSGPAHDSYMEVFNNQIYELQMMNGKVELLGHYLGLCTNQYSDTNNKVKNNWKKYIEEEKMKNNGLQ